MSNIKSIVHFGDCLPLMRETPDKYYDLAVVDPPYGINADKMNLGAAPKRTRRDGHGSGPSEGTAARLRKGRLNSGGGKLKNSLLQTSGDIDWDGEIPTPEYFEQLFRISKNQIIWGGNYFPLPPTRCIICWDKMQPWDNFSQWEMAWTSFDKPAKLYRISNTGGRNDETRIHPTQKPVKLYARLYTDFAKFGMKVFDSHLGSGSNRIAAANFGMDFTGCEKNRNHYEDQELRWRMYQQNQKLHFPTLQ